MPNNAGARYGLQLIREARRQGKHLSYRKAGVIAQCSHVAIISLERKLKNANEDLLRARKESHLTYITTAMRMIHSCICPICEKNNFSVQLNDNGDVIFHCLYCDKDIDTEELSFD